MNARRLACAGVRRFDLLSTLAPSLMALVAVAAAGRPAAAEYAGPTSYVDLPDFRAEGAAAKAVVAKSVTGDSSTLQLALLNPPPAAKGALAGYEIVPDAATKTWRVEAVMKSKTRKPLAKVAVEGDALTFQWEPNVVRTDGGLLRNCVLAVGAGPDQAVALRVPAKIASFPLDFLKDFSRVALVDDLPDESQLRLTVAGIRDADVSGDVSAGEVGVKEPAFIGVKAPTEAVPGVRLCAVLWKAGLKTELIIRSEMVAMGGDAPQATSPPVAIKPAADVDPTKPSLENPSFTSRSLATAKAAVTRQMQVAVTKLRTDQNLVLARQRALDTFDAGTDDPVEQMQIGQLRSELGALGNEITAIEDQIIPGLEKQGAAFEPLEKIRTSLNQKGTVALRVYYLVEGKPVDVLVMGEGEPAK